MTDEYNTKIFNLITKIDNCKNAFIGFSNSFVLDDEATNSSINFIFNSHKEQLEAINKDLFALMVKDK